jgi:hypothetical protein
MQPAQPRGAAVAPEPYIEPYIEPAAPARVGEAPPAAATAADGGPTGEFFTDLGADWRLTAAQQARLAPAVTAALDAGWTPRALATFTANTAGVRNPYAVLAARLSPAELPQPSAAASPAAVVRGVRRGHPDARLRRRRTSPLPALQASSGSATYRTRRKRPFGVMPAPIFPISSPGP